MLHLPTALRFWFALPSAPNQGEYHLEVTIYGVVQGRKQDELLGTSKTWGRVSPPCQEEDFIDMARGCNFSTTY